MEGTLVRYATISLVPERGRKCMLNSLEQVASVCAGIVKDAGESRPSRIRSRSMLVVVKEMRDNGELPSGPPFVVDDVFIVLGNLGVHLGATGPMEAIAEVVDSRARERLLGGSGSGDADALVPVPAAPRPPGAHRVCDTVVGIGIGAGVGAGVGIWCQAIPRKVPSGDGPS